MISVKKGLDLPIPGAIKSTDICDITPNHNVAVLGEDYQGLKPTMLVKEGDDVVLGQPLFEDKKNPGVLVCAPVSGVIEKIVRGERRRLLSVVIRPKPEDSVVFESFDDKDLCDLSREDIVKRLVSCGLWVLFRTRPFSKIPAINSVPHSIFVNAMDSNPLALDPAIAMQGRDADLLSGLAVMQVLSGGQVHFCCRRETFVPTHHLNRLEIHHFSGPHPAGLVGTHIHFIDPVGAEKTVWHLSVQDVLAIGKFFRCGILDMRRLVAITGPGVKEPKIVRAVSGCAMADLLDNNLCQGEQRVISGSALSGRQVHEDTAYLGVYDQQVTVLPEGRESYFLAFLRPGVGWFSRTNAYVGKFLKGPMQFNTSLRGSPRPIVPIGVYEEVMPLDILPTLLVKALIVKDTDTAISLGALELDEEDLALMSFVCPGKHDFGAILRENLTLIELEG
ncbi:MAG: Na(+)-translocating NADH-quinone reductase subunit A [Cardiobacteriaceae bacterium]|nr:Na(+)-translocating NADH-quinone reductase subunit A [Cardiobacteriaceae bacterium]